MHCIYVLMDYMFHVHSSYGRFFDTIKYLQFRLLILPYKYREFRIRIWPSTLTFAFTLKCHSQISKNNPMKFGYCGLQNVWSTIFFVTNFKSVILFDLYHLFYYGHIWIWIIIVYTNWTRTFWVIIEKLTTN